MSRLEADPPLGHETLFAQRSISRIEPGLTGDGLAAPTQLVTFRKLGALQYNDQEQEAE